MNIKYIPFEKVNSKELLEILNQDSIRKHLIEHPMFTQKTIKEWMETKILVDQTTGCIVRAISIDHEIAGWCAIQPDPNGYEIAIVLTKKYWGIGKAVFKKLLEWAKEFNHQELVFHLLESRKNYHFLEKISSKTNHSLWMGRKFTTYFIDLPRSTPS